MVSNAVPHKTANEAKKNYQIDFLRIVFTIFVFINHTVSFYSTEDQKDVIAFYDVLGWMSVMFFFIVSGFLMVRSIEKKTPDIENAGKNSIHFVINKFKHIALPYWVANAMFLFMFVAYYMYMYIFNDESKIAAFKNLVGTNCSSPFDLIINAITEALCITNVGGLRYQWNNGVLWYISSMLFVMLPLSYFLIKKRDFCIYVLCPTLAILTHGYLKQNLNFNDMWDGTIYLDIIKALCGLCFGVLSWTMCEKILKLNDKRLVRLILTFAEILLYAVFFATVLNSSNNTEIIFPVLLLLPIAVSITFSGKSYIGELFKFKWLNCLAPISLYFYLNHWAAINIIRALFPIQYIVCVFLAIALTVVLCIIDYLIVKTIKFFINKTKILNSRQSL